MNTIRIQTLTEDYFEEAREIENDFLADGKGFCFGCCPYSWCLMPQAGFASMHRRDEDKCSRYGLAIKDDEQDQNGCNVLGIIKLRLGTTPSNWMQNTMYKVTNDELYIDLLAVRLEARGRGIGRQLLEWAEHQARNVYGVAKLTLGVTKGNRAKNLYTRFGFVQVKSHHAYSLVWGVGMPNGRLGASIMEKMLT